MPKTKATSPARSQGCITTPKRKPTRGSRSLCSPALSTASGRLTSLIDQFKDKNMESFALSPLNGRSVLNDNTEIEEPRRKSWWKKLGENSQDVMEVLEDNQLTDVNDIIEEFIDIEVLSQERKNYTLDLPESSDNESINSIVLPQRKLFTQKENQPQKKYGHLIDNRESLAKLHKTHTANIEKTVNVAPRDLFQNTKRSKPIFPAALLNISPNKTKENILLEPKPQVRNIFGNRPANKRKNMFADFIVSESEDEIPDIEPKIFGFQKKIEQRRISSISRGRDGSPTSSITTDIEMDFRMLLPSSTMVENQLEDNMLPGTPIKRARLSKLSEAKESEAGTNTIQTNTTGDKTKQSNKSVSSKNKSRASTEIRDKSLNSSRTTRSMLKNASKRDEDVNTSVKQDTKSNKSLGQNSPKDNEININLSNLSDTDKQNVTQNKSQKQNRSKARHSPKAADADAGEIESEENINAINNVTRVINKSANKGLPNTTNKSMNEKERTITIKVHKTGAEDVEQNEQEEDENNFTLQYENDNEDIEESNLHNYFNDKQKDNIKTHNTVVLEKEIQETKMNRSKSNKSSLTNKSIQKQKPAKTVEESVESQPEQYSADDNIDGNVEQKREIIDQKMGENNISHEVSSKQMEQENENEMHVSQEIEDHNDSQEEVENESQDVENEGEESKAGVHESKKMDNVHAEDIENEEEESEADVTQSDKMADDLEMDSGKAKDVESDGEEREADAIQGDKMNDDLEMDGAEAKDVESDEDESEADVTQGDKMNDDLETDGAKAKDVESDGEKSEADATQGDKMDGDLEKDNAKAKDVESDGEESEADATQDHKMDDDLETDGAKAKDVESDEEESEADITQSDKMDDDLEMDSAKEEGNENEEESEDNVTQSDKMDDDLEVDSAKEEDNENEEESEDDVNQSDKMDDNLQMDSAEDDNAIASDSELSDNDDYQADEIEVDDVDEQSEHAGEIEHNQIESQEELNEVQPSSEEIDQSPNITHDTTGRYRKKDFNKSPEVILHDKTNQMDSFSAKGRNSSVRKTKSMIINLNKASLAPIRNSTGSDCTTNSSAEGSGWDSHRTTRKTLRQTFGKDFTPRKSLRALVMEKSAKRQTEHINMALHSETVKFPLANSTEMPEDSNHYVEDIVESDHEVSIRTRQTTLEMYLAKIKEQNIAENLKIEQAVRNSLRGPVRDLFKIPNKPAPRRPKPAQSKPKKQTKSIIPFAVLPSEVIEDMKYKPPKRFQPANACWITKRLYKYLENKLEPKYDYKARVRAEKLVETLYHFTKDLRRRDTAPVDAVEVLKHEFARLDVVRTHFEFYEFFNEFIPREIRIKVVPDIVNKIPLPRHGIFSDILI